MRLIPLLTTVDFFTKGAFILYQELEEMVAERCNNAVDECEEYLLKEYSGDLTDLELRTEGEKLVYKRAVKDVFEVLRFFQII
jgi:hypothetical protein